MRLRTRLALRCRPPSITKRVLQFVDEKDTVDVGHRIAENFCPKISNVSPRARVAGLSFPYPCARRHGPGECGSSPKQAVFSFRELVVLEISERASTPRQWHQLNACLKSNARLKHLHFLRKVSDVQNSVLSLKFCETSTRANGVRGRAYQLGPRRFWNIAGVILLQRAPTFRRLNCLTSALDLIVEMDTPGFVVDRWTGGSPSSPKSTGAPSPRPIKTSKYKDSVVAFTYSNREVWEHGTYLPDYPCNPD